MLPPAQLTPTSSLESLPSVAFEIDGNTQVRVVTEKFANEPGLPGVLITEAGKPLAVISQFRFNSHMKRAYSVEIYSKRSLTVLLEAIKGQVLVFPSTTSIKDAAAQSLDREDEFVFDPIVVEFSDGSRKLIAIKDLLRAAFQALSK